MAIIIGAPNLVRGGSHSGNIAAKDLVVEDLADIIASDYVPPAMIEAAWKVMAIGRSVPDAVAMVTDSPAQALGLHDRGRIEAGLRADLVRVREHRGPGMREDDAMPIVRAVWRGGERVA